MHTSSLLEHLFFSKWLYLILGMTFLASGNVLWARSDCLSDLVPQHLVNLFARLANDNIGYVDWIPYIPTVSPFSRLMWLQECVCYCVLLGAL